MTKSDEDFVSDLGSASERWLARVMVHAFQQGFRSADDFLEYFSPNEIMVNLEGAPDLRAKMLVEAAGVHERIASKKSTNSAAEDLRIALDEGICTAQDILELFPADERVKSLDNLRLWSFLTEDEFWLGSGANTDQAIARVAFMLDTALDEELITLQDIVDGISFEEIARRLPREDLELVVVQALRSGRSQAAFDEAALIDAVPLPTLLSHLSLETIWDSVVVQKVAQPGGLLAGDDESPKQTLSKPVSEPAQARPPATKDKNRRRKRTVVGPASALTPQSPPPAPVEAPKVTASKPEQDDLEETAARSPQEVEARKRVTDKLQAIDRLPPKHDSLPTGILLSMESMYAELFQLGSDEEREECIRDSFPNENHLTTAMLALIELLDPSIDITDPVIRDADVASLIKVVLFEERHRTEQANPSRGSAPIPPPPGQGRRAPTPPPLPTQGNKSTPPPLPPPARAPRAR